MAEARKVRFDQSFQCTPKRGDVRNAAGKARWKERCGKNIGSVISYAKKFKKVFHPKIYSKTKASPSIEAMTPRSCMLESNNHSKSSSKKPPFIVPGRIIYNDLYLIRSIPQVNNPPAKKNVTRTGVVKASSSQYGKSRQAIGKTREAIGKTREATNMVKPSKSIKDACPHCKGFIFSAGLTTLAQCIPAPRAHEVDELHSNSTRHLSDVIANPWITFDRRASAQKSFSSLLNSPESSTSQVSYNLQDGPEQKNSEDSDGESKSVDNKRFPHPIEKFVESGFENCVTTSQKEHHQTVVIAEVHRNNNELACSEFHVEVTESSSKTDFEESLHHAENSLEVAQHEQEVCQNNEGINGNYVKKSAIQIESPSKANAKEDTPKPNQQVENMEIAQQLRAEIKEKKTQLDELCQLWNNKLNEGNSIPNDEIGSVLTVIGQTQQLQRERFNQYADLILKFETNSDEKKITKTDLEGFWEMILLQVTDVKNKFVELDSLLGNSWIRQENVEFPLKKARKQKNVDKFCKKSSGVRSHIASLRKKQMESNLLVSSDCASYADQQPSLNPREKAFTLAFIDEKGPIIQQEIEPSNDEEFSTSKEITHTELRETPNYVKVQRGNRKKHKSANSTTFFSSPHQTESPRQRSHSANLVLDQPLGPKSSAENSSKLLKIPKTFSPTVKEFVTRTGRVSRSPGRFGHTEEERNSPCREISRGLSPTVKLFVTRTGRVCRSPDRFGHTEECKVSLYPPQSHLSQFTKPQHQNVDDSSMTTDHIGITKSMEENNNDLKDSFPVLTAEL